MHTELQAARVLNAASLRRPGARIRYVANAATARSSNQPSSQSSAHQNVLVTLRTLDESPLTTSNIVGGRMATTDTSLS